MLKETWLNSGVASRSGLIVGVVLILALTLAAAWWLLQSRNGVLFTDLESGDAAAVVAELERMKVNYQLAAEGTRILVPQDRVHEIRLKLLGSGLPLSGGVGFELFDKAEFGMTEFAQRINFQRALQGELTRTITSLKEVKYARVHLVMPEASLFQQNKNSPSASITLFLKSGAQLGQPQIEGIQRLVSAAVPGLEAGGVTIIDQYGKTLSALLGEDGVTTAVTGRLQKKREVEDYLTDKAAQVLEHSFGPGKAIVSIDVSLNFDQSQTTREEVIPGSEKNGGVLRRRESHTHPGGGKNKQKASDEVNTEVEYRLGRSVAQVVSTPGNIERLSVGVLVPTDTTEEQIRQVEDLVSMAVGLDRNRGDAIAVHATAAAILPELHSELSFAGETSPSSVPADAAAEQSELVEATVPGLRIQSTGPDGNTEFASWVRGVWERRAGSIVVVGVVVLIGLFMLVGVASRSRPQQAFHERHLEPAERERVLAQLKEWINADDRAAQGKGEMM